jgi:hypothetical protein
MLIFANGLGPSARETLGCRSCEGWRWPRPAAGRVHDRDQSAHRHRPVWLAPWERSGQRCDVRRECPRAQPLRKWVPIPIRRSGKCFPGYDALAAPSHGWGSRGGEMGLMPYGPRWPHRRSWVQPDSGCARTSRDQHHRKCRRNGLRRLGGLGSCRGLDRVFDPARPRADACGPTAGRSPRRCPWRSRCIAAGRGFGCHLLQPRRLARRMRRRHRVVSDPQHPRRPIAAAPFAAS